MQIGIDRRATMNPMTHIKAYTEDLDNNITFEYDVADRDVAKLVAELKRENLTVEVESK